MEFFDSSHAPLQLQSLFRVNQLKPLYFTVLESRDPVIQDAVDGIIVQITRFAKHCMHVMKRSWGQVYNEAAFYGVYMLFASYFQSGV